LRSVALQCGIRHLLHLSPLVHSEDLANLLRAGARVRAIELYQRRLERLAVGRGARAFAKRFGVLLP
jgi:hypothetical protein